MTWFWFEWLYAPFQHGFMCRALVASLCVALACSLLGVHVVLRRMAFFGDAIAHATLPGLVIAYLNRWNLLCGAFTAAVLTALGIAWLSRDRRMREDTAIGVLFSGMLALGVVLVSRTQSYRDFTHMLFGNVLAVTNRDLWGIGLVSLAVGGTLILVHKELVLTALDPLHSRVIGLSTDRLRLILLMLLAMAVVAGIQAVGVILTTSLLITPAATALLVSRRLSSILALSVLFAMVGCVIGLYASYYLSISTGGAIVLACALEFLIAFLLTARSST